MASDFLLKVVPLLEEHLGVSVVLHGDSDADLWKVRDGYEQCVGQVQLRPQGVSVYYDQWLNATPFLETIQDCLRWGCVENA